MRILAIDRFEGTFAICEDDERRAFAIEKSELPSEAREGDIIRISDDAVITIDKEETQRRRDKNKKLQDKLWRNK